MVESPHGFHRRLEVPICSLYSDARRPPPDMLQSLDALLVDLQDVGTRVYTFVWTLTYCLEACAEAGIPVIILDRPNPLGGRIAEGPLLDLRFASFVGRHTIPMRHAAHSRGTRQVDECRDAAGGRVDRCADARMESRHAVSRHGPHLGPSFPQHAAFRDGTGVPRTSPLGRDHCLGRARDHHAVRGAGRLRSSTETIWQSGLPPTICPGFSCAPFVSDRPSTSSGGRYVEDSRCTRPMHKQRGPITQVSPSWPAFGPFVPTTSPGCRPRTSTKNGSCRSTSSRGATPSAKHWTKARPPQSASRNSPPLASPHGASAAENTGFMRPSLAGPASRAAADIAAAKCLARLAFNLVHPRGKLVGVHAEEPGCSDQSGSPTRQARGGPCRRASGCSDQSGSPTRQARGGPIQKSVRL